MASTTFAVKMNSADRANVGVVKIRKLKQFEDNNRRLRQLVACLSLDKGTL
jgi:hypothetical protein